jgi:polyphosphate glucokinase
MRDRIKIHKAGASWVKSSLTAKRKHAMLRQHRTDAVLMSSMNHGVASRSPPKKVLVIDVGGTSVKILVTGQKKCRSFRSGPTLTPGRMVSAVRELAVDWTYDAVSIGVPGPVLGGRSVGEPRNLGRGWIGFNFARAFGRPVKVVNDAAMQALGSYKGGKMLFLGLGTGFGTAMVVDGVVTPMEVGHLPYKKSTYEDYVGRAGLKHYGKKKWRQFVADVVRRLISALEPNDTVIGGGNVKKLKELPAHCRPGENANAFRGGFQLWANDSVVPADLPDGGACEGSRRMLRRAAASENSPTHSIKRSGPGPARSRRGASRKLRQAS